MKTLTCRRILSAAVAAAAATCALPFAAHAATSSFSNATSITIPTLGTATPYPSGIDVSGLNGTVSKVTVTLTGFSHTCPHDVAVMLVAPDGSRSLLMADLGPGQGCPESTDANLTFDDAAAGNVPYPPVTGTYKPTDGEPAMGNTFPPPAPAGSSHPVALSTFNGTTPNGTWELYVNDEEAGDGGSIAGGWTLTLDGPTPSQTTTPGSPAPSPQGTPPDKSAPVITASGKSARLSRRNTISFFLRTNERSTGTAGGTINVPPLAKVVRFRKKALTLPANKRTKVSLKLSKRNAAAVRRALRARKRLKAKIRVTLKDAAGNQATKRLSLKLRR